jgi:hypothetical protein
METVPSTQTGPIESSIESSNPIERPDVFAIYQLLRRHKIEAKYVVEFARILLNSTA